MIEAIGWSALATATLLIGMVLAYRNLVNLKWTGLIMGFGAGAIISAAAYQLVLGAVVEDYGQFPLVGIGIAVGALTFYFADKWVDHLGGAQRKDFDGGRSVDREQAFCSARCSMVCRNPWCWACRSRTRRRCRWPLCLR
jgi:ZIP family zinc transporter